MTNLTLSPHEQVILSSSCKCIFLPCLINQLTRFWISLSYLCTLSSTLSKSPSSVSINRIEMTILFTFIILHSFNPSISVFLNCDHKSMIMQSLQHHPSLPFHVP